MDTAKQPKTTVRYGSEMVNLRIPLSLLPRINDHAKLLGISRSKLLLTGALRIMDEQTEVQPVKNIK